MMVSQADVRVLVVEDYAFLREGLSQFLNECEGITVVGSASDGREAIAKCGELDPNVVLMDLGLPEMDGITATRIIRHDFPRIQVVILTNSFGHTRREAAFAAGATAYLEKGVTLEAIADAIRTAAKSS